MKWSTANVLLAAVLAAGLIGCDGNGQAVETDSGGSWLGRLGGESRSDADGEWSVVLFWDESPDRHSLLRQVKRDTEQHTGWDDLMVVHEEGRSVLYWGDYRSVEQANRHVKKARAVKTPAGVRAFPQAMAVPLPGQDVGPAAWQLKNARGAYSICVASFYNVPEKGFHERKQAALAYCKQLREKGEEAYVHHGPSSSSVCIGAFPASSVRMVNRGGQKHPQILDARLERIMEKYPKLAVNGMEHWVLEPVRDPRTGDLRRERVLAKSYPVKIPDKEAEGGDALGRTGDAQSW